MPDCGIGVMIAVMVCVVRCKEKPAASLPPAS
jgi:hypothetical protein